jgi:hypothetical protein
VVAAEIAFARLAQEKGQWTAFRETAAPDAVMFVPKITNAQIWLKGKTDPQTAVRWQPHRIAMSCDGRLALSTGAWQGDGTSTGFFVTIWRQEDQTKRDAETLEQWKWVFDHGAALDTPLPAPDFVETSVAKCRPHPPELEQLPATSIGGRSADNSLIWYAQDIAEGGQKLTVKLWDGTQMATVLERIYTPQ